MEADTAYKFIRRAIELFVHYPLTSDGVLIKTLVREGFERILANKVIIFTYTAFGHTFWKEFGASLSNSYFWFTDEESFIEMMWKDEPIYQICT